MMNETVRKLVATGQGDIAWHIHHSLHPTADKNRWRSILRKEALAADEAWNQWLSELHDRTFAIKVQTEIATSRLYGQEPARWA